MQKRILSLLVLLVTAVTGAWAVSAVASIGSENYATLQAAFTAAETGQTIKLLSDVTQVGGVGKSDGKAVTFDLNGHIYTCTEDYVVMATNNSQITIIDSSTGTPGGIKSEVAFVGQENGKIIIKAGRYNIGGLSTEELLEYFPLWGVEMYSGYTLQDITPADAQGFCVGVVAPTPVAYTVALKSSTEDATNWQGKAGTGDYQSMPLTGLEAGTAVSVKYSGTKMVKSVKAVKKAAAPAYPMASEATAADYGKVVCAAGHLHDAKTAVPDGCTAVAVFAYIDGGNNRYGIALQDAENASWNTITNNGANNNTLCGVPGTWTVTAPTDASWFVGTKAIYEAIFINLGSTTGDEDGTTYDGNVNDYITAAGGTAISWLYSTTTVINEGESWDFGTNFWGYADIDNNYKVRPVLGFGGEATPAGPTDLSTISADYEAKDGETLTGTLTNNVKISIADGATVTLKNVNITNLGNSCNWAGINCPGDATLVLEGTNEVCAGRGGDYGMSIYPGIWIAPNKTLTIQGAGNLTAYSGGPYPDYPYSAGIGGGFGISCGNIVINSGTITATGGLDAAGIGGGGGTGSCGYITISGGTVEATGGGNGAGIGGGYGNACGNITISGGTVSATGGDSAAGIGGGSMNGACGNVTIKSTVTSVTATKGGQYAPYSIGRGYNGTAITVTIGGNEGAITTSPYTYAPSAPAAKPAATVTTVPTGAAGLTTASAVTEKLVTGGVADGGTLKYAITSTTTQPDDAAFTLTISPTVSDLKTALSMSTLAAGTYYVWYKVFADADHADSEAAYVSVAVAQVITWNSSNVSNLQVSGTFESYTKEGITLSANADMIEARWKDNGDPTIDGIAFEPSESGGFTFTAPTGKKFTKIEMTAIGTAGWFSASLGTGWSFAWDGSNPPTVTWTGSAASTVGLLTGVSSFYGENVKSIAFTLVDAE